MKEIWKNIDGEEHYQVSNCGRVRSLDRIDSLGRKQKGRILKTPLPSRGIFKSEYPGEPTK